MKLEVGMRIYSGTAVWEVIDWSDVPVHAGIFDSSRWDREKLTPVVTIEGWGCKYCVFDKILPPNDTFSVEDGFDSYARKVTRESRRKVCAE